MSKVLIRLLHNDCSAYEIEGKNGSTHTVDPELAERMAVSGHAIIVKEGSVPSATDKTPPKPHPVPNKK